MSPPLLRGAVGMVIASFMEADFDEWTKVARIMNTMPEAQRHALEERMVKHALREQVKAEGRESVLRALNDLGTRRSRGGSDAAPVAKDGMEACLASLCAFVRTLPDT